MPGPADDEVRLTNDRGCARGGLEQLALRDPLDASGAVYEPDGTFVYVNPSTERVFGRRRDDLLGRRIWDLFPAAVGNVFHAAFERVRGGGRGESFDHLYEPGGVWCRNQIYAQDGRIFVSAADITKRKQAEARLAAQARAADAFAHAPDVARVFDEIARVLAEEIGDVCTVRVLDEQTGDLALAALHDSDPSTAAFLREIASAPIPTREGLAARAFKEGRPILIPTVDESHWASFRSAAHQAVARRLVVRSLMATPLHDGQRAVGVIVMGRHRAPRPYTDEDLTLVNDLAGRAGLALSRARLARAERDATAALAATNTTLEAVISAAPMPVMLLDLDGAVRLWNRSAEHIFGWSAGEVIGRFLPAVAKNREKEFRANLARVATGQRFAAVATPRPTRHRGRIDEALGAAPGVHADGRVQCVSVVGDITDRKREEARSDRLARASGMLASSLDMQEILHQLVSLPLPQMADWCCVDILADDGWIDRVAVGHADPAKADVARRLKRRLAPLPAVPFGVAHAIKDGGAQLVEEMTEEIVRGIARDDDHLECIRAMQVRSYVCAPLIVGGRSLGAVTFLSGHRAYTEADLALAQELARRAAVVLENARLYNTTRGLLRRLETIHGVTSELSRARTPEEVASVAVLHGSRAAQADSCVMWLSREDGSMRLLDSCGLPDSERDHWRELPADPAIPGLRVVQTGTPLWVDSAEEYAHSSPQIFAQQRAVGRVLAYAALPLTMDGRRTGLLVFGFPLGHRFSDDEKDFLITLARQCEQALERAQLFSRQADARREADEARRVAEAASRAKDEFLAMLGHALRNPLAPIVTALQLMKLRGDSRSSKEQQVIERQVSPLLRLVDALLDISRITRGKVALKKEPFDFAEAVAKAVEMASPLLEQRQHRLQVTVPEEGVLVDGDVTRLAQGVANLLTNAAKYTDAEGHIEVTATLASGEVVLSVKDSGAGIEPDLLPRIFDLFTQGRHSVDRSQGGLRIGMTVARSLTEMHGGSVTARSAGPGRGSEFVVRLPALAPSWTPAAELPAEARLHPRAVRPRRVLIVDDNVDAAELMADCLRAAGHDVALAHDGAQAQGLADTFEPEVGLLDIGLPVMDGSELAGRLKERFALRMAAITGYGQDHDRSRSLQSGFDAHFVKPVHTADLLRYLDE